MAVESRVTQEEIKKEPEKPIDREKTCPLLLRVFTTNNGRHHRMDEFSRGNVPSSELQIYTWMDATLKELTSLVKEVYPEARKKGTHFNFAIVFTDLKRPGYRARSSCFASFSRVRERARSFPKKSLDASMAQRRRGAVKGRPKKSRTARCLRGTAPARRQLRTAGGARLIGAARPRPP